MRSFIQSTILVFVMSIILNQKNVSAQQYHSNILNYTYATNPTNGVKIKTNLPFTSSLYMTTVFIDGFSYGKGKVLSLKLSYYIYNNAFFRPTISSSGGNAPKVFLSNENGKVVIFIDEKVYYNQFTVSALGALSPPSGSFTGWTGADEALSGTATVEMVYSNAFGGEVNFVGGIWNKNGDVGIGTSTIPTGYKMAVAGKIITEELKVKSPSTSWPDYVFDSSYKLMPLPEVEKFIKRNQHLPEIPTAREVANNGVDVGANQALLLKKIEEVTLHLIELSKKVEALQRENNELKEKLQSK